MSNFLGYVLKNNEPAALYVYSHLEIRDLLTGVQEDADLAVAAAKKAFESWSKLPGHVRARHLYSIARHVQKHARYGKERERVKTGEKAVDDGVLVMYRLISVVESMDNGKPIRESRDLDIPLVARHFYHHAGNVPLLTTVCAIANIPIPLPTIIFET